MIDNELIEKWLKEGMITSEQAQKMVADVCQRKEESSSNKLIVVLSTIGAILLGIGVILFVASNWQGMDNIVKVLILLSSTAVVYYLGYVLRYRQQSLIQVGAALIFLSALLFGASIFLIAQIYHIQANSHVLVLIWLIGILPLIYALKTEPIAGLASLLFFVWIGLFVFKGGRFPQTERDFAGLPILYLVAGILLFGIGGIHYFFEELKGVARMFRISAIRVALLSLFILTFKPFSAGYFDLHSGKEMMQFSSRFSAWFAIFSVLAIIFVIVNLLFNPSESDTFVFEGYTGLGLSVVVLIFFFFPSASIIYPILFNLIMAGIILILLFIGYRREDLKLVNIGITFLWVFVGARYFDFFWKLFPRSFFFMVGGVILVLGGIVLEKKRRQLKQQFGETR
ncbi:MAG: DUF2157 domain-containing protein [Elusimicrobiota bacterium]